MENFDQLRAGDDVWLKDIRRKEPGMETQAVVLHVSETEITVRSFMGTEELTFNRETGKQTNGDRYELDLQDA